MARIGLEDIICLFDKSFVLLRPLCRAEPPLRVLVPPSPHLNVKVQKSVIMPKLIRLCFKLLLLCLFLKNSYGFSVILQKFQNTNADIMKFHIHDVHSIYIP